jgi:hypothetical protein
VQASHLEGVAGDTRAQGSPEVDLVGDLGLDVIGKPVAVVAREDLAARHGVLGAGGPHLLDVAVVGGVDNGRDVKVGQAVPAVELDLAEHAGNVGTALGDGVEVANIVVGELNGGPLGTAHSDGVHGEGVLIADEVDGAHNVVEGPEGDAGGAGKGSRADEAKDSGRETHVDGGNGVYIRRRECGQICMFPVEGSDCAKAGMCLSRSSSEKLGLVCKTRRLPKEWEDGSWLKE